MTKANVISLLALHTEADAFKFWKVRNREKYPKLTDHELYTIFYTEIGQWINNLRYALIKHFEQESKQDD